MKKHIIIFSLLFSLMVSFTVNAGPIEVSTTEINFGVVKKGTDKQETFTVSNTSANNVSVTVDASTEFTNCFEVSDNLQRFTLKPGGSKTITVTSHGLSAGGEASTEVYILNYRSETVATVKLKAFGDDDSPLVDRTSLTMNVGEKASVYLKTIEYSTSFDVEGIVDCIGGGPGTSSGPADGHNSLYSHTQSGLTFTALKPGVVHVTFKHLYTDETAVLTITVIDPNPPVVNRYAIYNYRNDGDFNAFLNVDVDSITFSNIDMEGRTHPNVVVQEVWTPDSVYRIPLAAIDSISFNAPKTKIKDDVFFITDEHIPYTVSVDSLRIVFNASIPQDLLPSEGNVLVSETFETPYEEGFVGRVNKVRRIGNLMYVACDDADLFDIYDSLVAVGKIVTDSTESPNGAPRRLPRRILGFDDIDTHGVETFNLGKITLKKAGWKWLSVEYTPEFSIDYVLYIQKNEPVHIKLAISGKHDLNLVLDYKAYDTNQDSNVEKEIWPYDPPFPSFYGFAPTFKLGLFWDIGGKVDVVGKLPVTITHTLGVEYHGSGHFDINDVNIIKSFDMKFKEPTLDFKIVGYATAGVCADVGVKFLHKKIASIDAILKMGPKVSTTFDLSANDIARDPGVYTVLKNTKVAVDFDMGIDAEYRFLKKKAKIIPGKGWPGVKNVNQWEDTPYPLSFYQWSWPLYECYLMPEFTSHVVNAYDGSNLTFATSASREMFLPVKLGVRKETSSGQKTTIMNLNTYWKSGDTWAKNFETTFPTLTGLNYTFKPIVEFLGCQIEATPEVAVNTEEQTVTLEAGQTLVVDAKDANGKYTVQSFDPSGVGCTVKGSKITITAYHACNTYILVTNTKNNSNYFIHVTVTGGQGTSVLSITPATIDFGEVAKGKTETRVLSINNDSSSPQTVTATVDAPFSFTDGMSSMSSTSVVVPGKSCGSLTVAFTSTTPGDYDGNITLSSEALTGGKLIVPVHARAVTNVDEHEWVDLGLPSGTLWATCNVGANSPEEYGDYFAWGETEPKEAYTWENYKWCNGSANTFSKYCTDSDYGTPDNRTALALEDDAAYVNWGLSWRMPNTEQQQELLNNCMWVWTTRNGVNGQLVTGPNGNSIFLPAAGYRWNESLGRTGSDGYYWSRSLYTHYTPKRAYCIDFTNSGCSDNSDYRYYGYTIRAVYLPENDEYVDLGLPSGTLWAKKNIGASCPEEYGDYFAWGETEPKEAYTWENYKWCNGTSKTLTKYCTNSNYGTVDNMTELELQDDAAHVNWGPSWRMPSSAQQYELKYCCIWEWTTINGVNGQLVTGPNGNTLFLPAGGRRYDTLYDEGSRGYYFSHTLSDEPYFVKNILFSSEGFPEYYYYANRPQGHSVRAVLVSPLYIKEQSLDMGVVFIGDSQTSELTIANNTPSPQTVIATIDAPFSFKQGESSTSSITIVVPSYSFSSVTVVFKSTSIGDYRGTATFTCNAIEGKSIVIPLHVRVVSDVEIHEYVDLGLPSGTLWATMNVGANSPEDYGDYFAWGETEPKDVYDWSTYKWCNGNGYSLTKYCTDSYYGYNDFVDDKTELDPEDDAAYVNWGPSWRMPTKEQFRELCEQCTWAWDARYGVKGRLVTGPNGNTLFLPAAGAHDNGSSYGYYWSRTLGPYSSNDAYNFGFSSGAYWNDDDYDRYDGCSVRAVRVP